MFFLSTSLSRKTQMPITITIIPTHESTLNPNAQIFVPKYQLSPADISHLEQLDRCTQISLDALWQEYVNESIILHYADETEDEIAQIRATH